MDRAPDWKQISLTRFLEYRS